MNLKKLFTDLKDTTSEYDKKDIENGKLMSVLAYLGILCLIPYFVEKDNKFVRYHVIQGINLFFYTLIYSVAFGIVSVVLVFIPFLGWMIIMLLGLISYVFLALSIWGIVYVFQEKAKELPIINKYKLIQK
jgi:uncharacterized membrane protein